MGRHATEVLVQDLLLSDLADVAFPATPVAGTYLKWDGNQFTLAEVGAGPWQTDAGGTAIIPVDTQDSWIVGSDRMDRDVADVTKDKRAFFSKTKGAFRAGLADGSEWDNVNVGYYSHAEGLRTQASNTAAHAEGLSTNAAGGYTHAEGQSTLAVGIASHAEGISTVANGNSAHAEGSNSEAVGLATHAEGYWTKASAEAAHAEGQRTVASGANSHAEGFSTTASFDNAHAEGYETQATGLNSHAEGVRSLASRWGQYAKSSWNFAAIGDAQIGNLVLLRQTTDATATLLLAGNRTAPDFSAGLHNVWTLPTNRVHKFRVDVAARRTDVAGEAAGWEFSGLIARDATGNPYFVGNVEGRAWSTVATAAWDVTLSINVDDPANPYLAITVTGEALKTIRWVASLDVVEVG